MLTSYHAITPDVFQAVYHGGCYEPDLYVTFNRLDVQQGNCYEISVEFFCESGATTKWHLSTEPSLWKSVRWFEENLLDQLYTFYMPSRRFPI